MKVVIIGPAHPLRGGGLATFNHRLALAFLQQGHQASIYSFSLQYPSFLFPGTSQYTQEPAPEGIPIRTCIHSISPLNWLRIGRLLQREKLDIIVVRFWIPFMGPCLGTILRIAKKNHHTRIVCIADNIMPHEKRLGDRAFTRYFLKPCDAFITMSKKVMNDLRSLEKHKPARQVNHPLYDTFGDRISKTTARTHLHIPKEERVMLFFGFIRPYKGLDLLLEALSLLKKTSDYADIKLIIAGEFYEDEHPYLEKIKTLGLEKHLYLHTHFISDSEIKYYLCAADVVIQPYKNATQSGVTPLAYHFEKPMIVTNVGGLPDLVPHEKVGIIVEPNAKSIAAGIERFYELGESYFMPHLIEEKKNYQWERLTQTIAALAYSTT